MSLQLPDPALLDAGKRASEIITLHLLADYEHAIGSWVAIRLSDGGSDNVLYDTRDDAIKHQLHEFQCCYVNIPPDGMTIKDAMSYIASNRKLVASGMRMTDPEHVVGPALFNVRNGYGNRN